MSNLFNRIEKLESLIEKKDNNSKLLILDSNDIELMKTQNKKSGTVQNLYNVKSINHSKTIVLDF
jgi:hypothetical protein